MTNSEERIRAFVDTELAKIDSTETIPIRGESTANDIMRDRRIASLRRMQTRFLDMDENPDRYT